MELFIKIIYALPVYQAFILMLLLLIKWFGSGGKHLLLMAIFQFIATVYFIFNFLYAIQSFESIGLIYPFILPLILLFAPLFYLYLKAVSTPGFRFSKENIYHVLPSAIYFLLNLPFILAGSGEKLIYVSQNQHETGSEALYAYFSIVYISGIYLVLNFQFIYYLIRSVRIFRKHQEYIDNHYSYTENISLGWFKLIALSFFFFLAANQMLYFSGIGEGYFSAIIYNISMLVISLLVAYYSLMQRELKPVFSLSEHHLTSNSEPELIENFENESVDPLAKLKEETSPGINAAGKYAGSTLQEVLKVKIVDGLTVLMENEKAFTNPSLSLDDVALRLNTNTKYISQAINEHFGRNFYHFVNFYRIEEAKRLMLEEENLKYSIYGIAQMVGFGSKSSFNAAFRKFTGLTPTGFISNTQTKS
jgi:AraC-like DNA-binding protein